MDTNTNHKINKTEKKEDEVKTYSPHINVKVNTYTKESYEFFTEVSDGEIEDIIKWLCVDKQYYVIVAVAKLSYTNGTNGYATNIGKKREIDTKKKNNNINNL